MNEEVLLRNVSQHIPLDPEEKAYFLSLLQSKRLMRKEALLKQGDICRIPGRS